MQQVRALHHAWEQKPGECGVARAVAVRLRALRKPLMATYAKLPLDKLPTAETAAVRRVLREATRKKA